MKALLSRDSDGSTGEASTESPTGSERRKSATSGTGFNSQSSSQADDDTRNKSKKNKSYLWKTDFAAVVMVDDSQIE